MFSAQEIFVLRKENALLKTHNTKLKQAYLKQKGKTDVLKDENAKLKREIVRLKEELEKIKKQRDTYKGMIFKPNIQKIVKVQAKKKKLGGQAGHRGNSRRLPQTVVQIKRVYFQNCPHCNHPLKRTNSVEEHTVEDIPDFEEIKTTVVKFESERQWCRRCAKEVVATPLEVIPNSRLGIHLIIQVLIFKYVCRMSFEIIVSALWQTYGLRITTAGLINTLKRTKVWLGPEYGKLLDIIRGSPVKHADETGWRIKGLNGWLWAFLTKDSVYYTIEHSRGGGVARNVLSASSQTDVLVRDDYAGYKNLKLNHQSCLRHLLGESREASEAKDSSKEVRNLHKLLKRMYKELATIIEQPFDPQRRQAYYQYYSVCLKDIVEINFQNIDAKKIQVRIKNQGNNLITAILYKNVPLTNNLAERQIRPAVVIRKISGGSRSDLGAQTFAVNMSVIQTLKMRNQPLIPALHDLLLNGALGKTN